MAKVWFITGASSGFGEALAKAVIERGDKVIATFRKAEQASAFSQQYNDGGLGVVMDVTDEAQIKAAVQQALQKFKVIDVLVNNAGYGTVGAIEEFSMEEIRAQMETNVFGAIAMTKELLPLMRKQKSGHIIQISSQAGIRATAGFGVYNTSKFALEGFSEALSQEVAPFGIKVVIVQPGPFRTQFAGSSIKAAQTKMPEYDGTPVGQTYQYISKVDGTQEGDPVKGANAIVDYVHNGNSNLRLPLGKSPIQAIRSKLAQVEADLKANEAIALSTIF
ncbi:MAG: family NAD(P)-dependent oxidoreductase [Flavisolibacter sp.]|jgi:NAD(P)-dependent dehydrogenase (short-subunit alcohol dehydrogenase family)|nr:family NAD(P)-dependent oxidoreductase [Flavisolibacter sp.]